jgi:Ca-activated chloride channel family protein
VLTDGADGRALEEAARARAAGYRVSALGLGTAQGGVFDTAAGLGDARLDAGSLRALAASGGGGYRRLTAGDADLRALGVLEPRAGDAASAAGGKVATWRDDGYWLLPWVLLLALPMFRRGAAVAAMLMVALLVPMPPAQAQAQAQQADSWWRRPDQQAHARLQEGVAAYRRQQYEEAIGKFSGNTSAEGQYNLGNALAKAGRYDDAIAAYDRALKLRPAMPDAIANRAVVDAARKRKPPPGGNPQPDPQQGNRQGKPPPPQPGGQAPGQPPGQAGGQQGKPQQPAGRTPPPDPRRQQQADAAQRQRMQDALRKQQQPPKAQDPATRQARETPAQRERRVANQAQLQRVPDDPGALLRARFRLEYERRQGRTR